MPEEFTSADYAQLIADKEGEIREALNAKQVVEQEDIAIGRQILELRLKKKDLESAVNKASHNVRVLEIEKRLLEKKFWSAKNAGT